MQNNKLYLIKLQQENFFYWHYIEVSFVEEIFLKKAMSKKTVDIKNIGKVVESGWGMEPPTILHQELEKKYGQIFSV